VKKDFDEIASKTAQYLKDELDFARTFKVSAKRADKSFHMNSPQICAELGGYILQKFPHLKVDVNNPDVNIMVEIREKHAYIHSSKL
ncbi:MAG: THUMP domain-containing protein, partial [Oscillospiraceae bacterium]|nr:THUMP domain-containing protein [Oscillospiraceae bacterium]